MPQTSASPAAPSLRLMVSSAVYGMEEILDQVYGLLASFGYEVWMSHKGTVHVTSSGTAFDQCLRAVENCDFTPLHFKVLQAVEAADKLRASDLSEVPERTASRRLSTLVDAGYLNRTGEARATIYVRTAKRVRPSDFGESGQNPATISNTIAIQLSKKVLF